MRNLSAIIACTAVVAAGCSRSADQQAPGNDSPAEVVLNANPPATATEARADGGIPGDRTPIEEPKGPIDPGSPEAAGQVMQSYGALIEQKRFAEAATLWRDAADARKFVASLDRLSEVHLEIGKPGGLEGAAGSIYDTVPVKFYGKLKAGGNYDRRANAILRRVNDVPGSTAEQRRWHIERIEWADGR